MKTNPFTYKALIGFACLVFISVPSNVAAGLREEAVSYRVQGYEAHRRGDGIGALEAYKKAIALDSSYATPHNDIGVLMEEQGNLEQAKESYSRALLINPHYLEAHANLAMLYERLGEKEKAIYHWLKRYQLGEPFDPWTIRAEDRLVAMGVLQGHAGMKSRIYSRRRLLHSVFEENDKTIAELEAVTEDAGRWP